MTVGEKIRLARQRKGVSQEAVAKALKTTKQNIYKYETGIITNIPTDKIEALASYLGVTPAYLMGWEETAPPTVSDQHSITIRGRDGSVIEKDLTDEQLELIARMIEQFDKK